MFSKSTLKWIDKTLWGENSTSTYPKTLAQNPQHLPKHGGLTHSPTLILSCQDRSQGLLIETFKQHRHRRSCAGTSGGTTHLKSESTKVGSGCCQQATWKLCRGFTQKNASKSGDLMHLNMLEWSGGSNTLELQNCVAWHLHAYYAWAYCKKLPVFCVCLVLVECLLFTQCLLSALWSDFQPVQP